MASYCNIIAREFLSDVNKLCSTGGETKDDEEESHMVSLVEYLMNGRGLLLLTNLNSTVDQELSCREELITLILSLLPLVWKIPVEAEKAREFTFFSLEMDQFLIKESLQQPQKKTDTGCVSNSVFLHVLNVNRLPHKSRRHSSSIPCYSLNNEKASMSSSDSEATLDDKSLMAKQRHPQLLRPPHTCHIQECRVIDNRSEQQKEECKEDKDCLTEISKEILPIDEVSSLRMIESSPFDLCLILLSLLEKVSKFDILLNHSSTLSVCAIPALSDFLAGFDDSCSLAQGIQSKGWTEESIALIQRMLLRTVLYLLTLDINSKDVMPDNLQKNLIDLLRTALKHKQSIQNVLNSFTFSDYKHQVLLMPELLGSVFQILLSCLKCAPPNPLYFSQSIELLHEFIQNNGFDLFENTVLLMESVGWQCENLYFHASDHVSMLIDSVIKIMSVIKKVKSEQLHQSMCTRKRHRRCEFSHFMHHHRDLTGLPVSLFKSQLFHNSVEEISYGEVCYPERSCCIAVCAHHCLCLLERASKTTTCLQIIMGIQNIGICCCMYPTSVVTPLLYAFKLPTLKNVQHNILNILAYLILDQLGGSENSRTVKQAACNICLVDSDHLAELQDTIEGKIDSALVTGFCTKSNRCEGVLPRSGTEDIMWKWDSLAAYQEIVFGNDPLLSLHVAGHICHVIRNGNAVVQWKLYTLIFNGVLQRGVDMVHHSQKLGISTLCSQTSSYHNTCLPEEVLKIYLKILPELLQSRVVRELFLNSNGLNKITELIYLDPLRCFILKIFEALICFGETHIDYFMSNLDIGGNDSNVLLSDFHATTNLEPNVNVSQSLSTFYSDMKESCPKKKKDLNQKINMMNLFLCLTFLTVSKDAESDLESVNESEDTSGYDSTASEPLSILPKLNAESLIVPPMEQIHKAVDNWSMCYMIYMSNSMFQKHFHKIGGFDLCYRIVRSIINKFASCFEDFRQKRQPSLESENVNQTIVQNEFKKRQSTNSHEEALSKELNSCQGLSDEAPYNTSAFSCIKTSADIKEWSSEAVKLLETVLAICLHSVRNGQLKIDLETSQNLSVQHIILEIQEHLAQTILQTDLASDIFDCLLRIAVSNFSSVSDRFEKQQEQIHKSDDLILQHGETYEEVDEVLNCSLSLLAEEGGYEADSESNPEDAPEDDELKTEFEEMANSHDQVKLYSDGELLYPEICALVLNLLSAEHAKLPLLTSVFHALVKIVKAKRKNILLLVQQGTTKILLTGFQFILSSSDPGKQECLEVLINLLVSLMSYSISSDELGLFLRYFLSEKVPIEILIKGILDITEANNGLMPVKYITFPFQQNPAGASGIAQKNSALNSVKMSGFFRRAKICQSKDLYCKNLLTTWHIAPIHLPLVGQNCWPHMSDGFSFTMWFKLEHNSESESLLKKGKHMSKKNIQIPGLSQNTAVDRALGPDCCASDSFLDGCLHMLSLGSKVLMMQIWTNITTGHFIFRVCAHRNDDSKCVLLAHAETPENVLLPGNWQHLAFTYKELSESKNKVCSKIIVWVSGQRKAEISLEYNSPQKGSLSSDSSRTFCMIGYHASSQDDNIPFVGQLSLGNLLLFNGPTLDTEEAFDLFCRGPDFTSLMTCKHGSLLVDHFKYISEEILQNEQIHAFLMNDKGIDLSSLTEKLAVVYDMHNPSQYTIYEPVIRIKGSIKTALSQRPFSSKEVTSKMLDSQSLKMLQPCFEKNIHSVLHEIGGIGAIVFLFARVVEISSCEKTQALGLQIILYLIKCNQQRIQESENCDIYSMIHQVLIQPKCIVGFHMLKTLLKGCTGDWLLIMNEDEKCSLCFDTTSVILDIRLLERLLLDFKIWSKAENGVWETLQASLEILIRDNHPHKDFNINQLLKAKVVHNFLLACQVLQEHREEQITIPQNVCKSYVKIIEEVLGSPPEMDLLRLIFSFLLAVHPPTNTYVCHNPNNLFFSVHIDDKIFQEKLTSVINQRSFSFGGCSAGSPLFSRPLEFSDMLSKDTVKCTVSNLFSTQQYTHLSVVERSCSKSLPASPSSSPKMPPKQLGGGLFKSIDDLTDTARRTQKDQEKIHHSENSLELLKRKRSRSQCESFIDPDSITLIEPCKEDLVGSAFSLENKTDDPSRISSESTREEVFLQRPDNLKGIYSPRKERHNIAGCLSCPSSGSLTSTWTDILEKKKMGDWSSFPSSPLFDVPSNVSSNIEERSVDNCIHLVCCGLYDLLCGVLLTMPDVMVTEVLDEIIQSDVLVVLVNHPSPLIQQGVLKLLDAYFHRASKEYKEAFLNKSGFSLLANQLYIHQGNQIVAELLLKMFFGRNVGLDEEFEVDDVRTVSSFRKWCIIPLLGLIENFLHHATLLHSIFCLLLQILNSCSKVADMLLDSGLMYVLCNTLATLCGIESSVSLDEFSLLACDLQQLLIAITIHACSSSGLQYFRIVEDLIILLEYISESKNERMQSMAVLMQFRILHSAIEFIKTTSNQDFQAVGSAYNFMQSSQAKCAKRKNISGAHRLSFAQYDPLLITLRSVASTELTELMQRRMSQENPIRASESEFVQRLQRLTILAVNRLIYQDVSVKKIYPESQFESSEDEMQLDICYVKNALQNELFKIMIEGIRLSLSPSITSSSKHQWKTILLLCNETFCIQLGRLMVHGLSPSQPTEERKKVLQIVSDPKHRDILTECLSPGLQHGPKLALYLFELMHDHKDELTTEDQANGVLFISALKQSGYRCIPPNAPPNCDVVKATKEEQKKYENEENSNKVAWKKTILNNQQRLLQRLDSKLKDISKIAGDITQSVSLSQGMERKNVIQHIRGMYKIDLSACRHWQELVQQLTHDRAIWYDPESYPSSYQLDPTEGPNRERRRLQRCYITIPNKYILRDRQKQEESYKPPLSYLFEDKTHSSLSSSVKEKAASELIRVNRRCINVAPSRETVGELLLGKTGMYFVEDSCSDTVEFNSLLVESEPASFSWTYKEIKEVHKRWWQLRDNALEIFLTNGRTLLLAFDSTKVRDDIYQKILTNDLPNLLEYGNIAALTQLWCSGQITNFEYLTHLNKHAGRSFNDLMQYPVFPFILNDYTSEALDLNNMLVYRNLVKPIAVQSKEKEDRYIDNYKYLEDEYCKGDREDDPMPPVQPYHYGSHYSNSGTVLHFLVRMPPFTKMFLAYQDQSFDIPDRTFHSMNTTWRLSSYESMTDVKELIPEFFYLPEFLVNREGFDFGIRQNGDRVNNVNLPPWARNDPRLLILIHRQALESDYVSQTICNWIDLVFGYKQKGRAAVQAINVFHPATYFGMDVSAVEDPVQRRALETMIKTYGQTPRQLFHTAHVNRPGSKLLMEGELPAAMGLLVQLAFRENRENTKENVYPSPLPWIRGLKWGEYVGSPSAPDPIVCFSQPHGERFGSLQALSTRAICGLSKKFCLMMNYSKEQGVQSMHSTDIQWSAILSWGYADNILRLKSKQSEPPVNFIQCSQLHQVTSCAWVPDSCQLYTGSKCGVVTAYLSYFTHTTPMEIKVESQVHLYGHTGEITSLFVCKTYSILISVSMDGTCIIWDLNRLCYVQSLTDHKSPVTAVSASETSGDIATVCDSVGGGSDLRLWTVNGDLIGHVHCVEIICSVAFSNQPEGISVNVLAGGLENGVVRLWSTWDLKPVREITFPKSNKPIISLTFSCDGHHLYTANSEGTVIGWCRKDQQRLKLPMFYSFLSTYAAC